MSEQNGGISSGEQQDSHSGEHSGEHHSHHGGSHRHHHKKHFQIPKNTIIIALAVLFFAGFFGLLIHQLSQQDEETLAQIYTGEISSDTVAAAIPGETAAAGTAAESTGRIQASKETVSWCALGDGITCGYSSETDAEGGASSRSADRESVGWAYLVAKEKGWNLTNLALPGEGYLVPASEEPGTCGYEQARATDFTPYNLVTISLGISDWISDCPMGTMEDDPNAETITAFIPAMRATIEAVASSNPMCKIIVILPLNTSGYDHSCGTKETNWAMGYAMSNTGTLKQFTETMIEVCERYGIEYIDMTSRSCVSSVSLPAMLPDGVHPAAETHKLLARELAEKISFR